MPFGKITNNEGSFVEDGLYFVQVADLQDAPANDFGPGMKWIFTLWDQETKVQITNPDGSPYELYQYSSASLNRRAKARGWAEALLARELAEDEDPDAVAASLLEKTAVAVIKNEEKDGKNRCRIVSLTPRKAGKPAAKVAASPPPEPVAAGAASLPWEE